MHRTTTFGLLRQFVGKTLVSVDRWVLWTEGSPHPADPFGHGTTGFWFSGDRFAIEPGPNEDYFQVGRFERAPMEATRQGWTYFSQSAAGYGAGIVGKPLTGATLVDDGYEEVGIGMEFRDSAIWILKVDTDFIYGHTLDPFLDDAHVSTIQTEESIGDTPRLAKSIDAYNIIAHREAAS
ncbi:MAG: hypothetical protein AAGA56_08830 [Myxococcota bacterium]